jgi:hypothetical protein
MFDNSSKYVLAVPYEYNSYSGVAEYRYINPSQRHPVDYTAIDFYETYDEACKAYREFKQEYNNRQFNKIKRVSLPACRILIFKATWRR